ncbi:hypothetical protein GOODEAATRI_033816 [Goodea atripinnis]|uniref:Uncharacterized protein n=1 Tax=Goodea atripinnis TaxID=208336 RepID=A0ABV0PTX4_9TELE
MRNCLDWFVNVQLPAISASFRSSDWARLKGNSLLLHLRKNRTLSALYVSPDPVQYICLYPAFVRPPKSYCQRSDRSWLLYCQICAEMLPKIENSATTMGAFKPSAFFLRVSCKS